MKKFANWALYEKAAGPLPASIAIVGSDEFERSEAIEQLTQLSRLSRKKVALASLLNELSATSFFDSAAIFHIELGERLKAKDQEVLSKALSMQHSNLLLISGSSLPKGLECEVCIEIAEAKPWEKQDIVQRWLTDFLLKEKRPMQRDAIQRLAKEFQANRTLLKRELEKLFLYTLGKKEITLADVEAVCIFESKPLIWHLSDALLQKNEPLSLQYVAALRDGDIHPLALIRYFRTQFHEALKNSAKPKLKQAAVLYGLDGLQEALIKIDELEVKLKNSEVDEELQLELLVIQLCKR